MTSYERTSWLLGLGAMASISLGAVLLWPSATEQRAPQPDNPPSQLAERINSACPKGYKIFDWAVNGESNDLNAGHAIPPGIVRVTCVREEPFDQLDVAVAL